MTEYVRVRDLKTGHHYTTSRLAAQADGLEILEGREAIDSSGRPLPTQYNVTIDEAAQARKPKGA